MQRETNKKYIIIFSLQICSRFFTSLYCFENMQPYIKYRTMIYSRTTYAAILLKHSTIRSLHSLNGHAILLSIKSRTTYAAIILKHSTIRSLRSLHGHVVLLSTYSRTTYAAISLKHSTIRSLRSLNGHAVLLSINSHTTYAAIIINFHSVAHCVRSMVARFFSRLMKTCYHSNIMK